jgi:hypothetical protein
MSGEPPTTKGVVKTAHVLSKKALLTSANPKSKPKLSLSLKKPEYLDRQTDLELFNLIKQYHDSLGENEYSITLNYLDRYTGTPIEVHLNKIGEDNVRDFIIDKLKKLRELNKYRKYNGINERIRDYEHMLAQLNKGNTNESEQGLAGRIAQEDRHEEKPFTTRETVLTIPINYWTPSQKEIMNTEPSRGGSKKTRKGRKGRKSRKSRRMRRTKR